MIAIVTNCGGTRKPAPGGTNIGSDGKIPGYPCFAGGGGAGGGGGPC